MKLTVRYYAKPYFTSAVNTVCLTLSMQIQSTADDSYLHESGSLAALLPGATVPTRQPSCLRLRVTVKTMSENNISANDST